MTGQPVLKAGTLVIFPGRHLGQVTKAGVRLGRARGINVRLNLDGADHTEGFAPHFCPDGHAQVARVGVNVCPQPAGRCWCGLLHVREHWIAKIRAQQEDQ